MIPKSKSKVNAEMDGEWIGWPLFFLFLWWVLLRSQNPDLMSDDSGEMIAGSFTLGLPHPPGYPLFDLIGRLFSFLPVGTVAFRYNLISEIAVLAALGLLLKTCLVLSRGTEFGRPRENLWATNGMLVFAGLVFISCRSVFAQSLTAKGAIYALTLLLVNGLAYLRVSRAGKGINQAGASFVVFLWALGLGNHWQTVLLLTPFIGFWFYQEKWKLTVKKIFFLAVVAVLACSPYLYLPLRAVQNPSFCWGDPVSWRGFVWVISRKAYAGFEPLVQDRSFYLGFLDEFSKTALTYWFPGFTVLVGLGFLFVLRDKIPWGYSLAFLFACVWTGIFLIHEPENLYLAPVYLLSVAGLWLLFGFAGFWALWKKIPPGMGPKWKSAMAAVVFLLLAGWGLSVFRIEDKSRYTLAGDFGINVLRGIPKSGVLIADGDHYVMPISYDQAVLGLRPDILFIPSVFLFHEWGWEQLSRHRPDWKRSIETRPLFRDRFQWLATPGDGKENLFYSFGSGYLNGVFGNLRGFLVPSGLAYQWRLQKPAINGVLEQGRALLRDQRLRGLGYFGSDENLDPSTLEIYRYYGDQYFLTARWLEGRGDEKDALAQLDRGIRFYPKDDSAYNDMAAIVGRQGYLGLARQLCLEGLAVNPESESCLLNLANSYWLEGRLDEALKGYKRAAVLFPDAVIVRNRLMEAAAVRKNGLPPLYKPRNQKDYQQLALFYRHHELFFLAGEAARVAQALSTGDD